MNGINIDQLANEIAENLEYYTQNVVEKINVSSDKVAKEAVKKLKATSPKQYGAYAKGWRQKEDKFNGQPNTRTVHNKTHYQLTHLLENGHAKSGGGRVEAFPHIGKAEEEVIREFTQGVEEAIRNG